jgi:hypothetical protein
MNETVQLILALVTLVSLAGGGIWSCARLSTAMEHLTDTIQLLRTDLHAMRDTQDEHAQRLARLEVKVEGRLEGRREGHR